MKGQGRCVENTVAVGINRMCIICVELEKNRLTSFEARRNFGEMKPSLGDHAEEVEKLMLEKEVEEILKGYIEFSED